MRRDGTAPASAIGTALVQMPDLSMIFLAVVILTGCVRDQARAALDCITRTQPGPKTTISLAPNLPFIRGGQELLMQIASNLLDNAPNSPARVRCGSMPAMKTAKW